MKSEPLVTIYIPTFNRSQLLLRAVQSVLQQTYQNLEVIIVDDGSSDDTPSVIEQLQNGDPRVRFYKNERTKGACGARNTAIFQANGALITGLDDDDYFLPDRIERFIHAWNAKETEIEAISSCYFMKTPSGTMRKIGRKSPQYVKNFMLFHVNFIGNQIFTKTTLLRELGGFDESMPMWQDFDLWSRLTKVTDCKRIIDATYVIDVSHEHERISGKKKDSVANAFDNLTKKHELNCFEQKGVKLQMRSYQVVGKTNLITRAIHKLNIQLNYFFNKLFRRFIGATGA